MTTRADNSQDTRPRKRTALVALAILTACSLGTTAYLMHQGNEAQVEIDAHRLRNERLLGEKLQLQKEVAELGGRLDREQQQLLTNDQEMRDLRSRVQAALDRNKGLEASARKGRELAKEVEGLRDLKQRLETELSTARNDARDLEQQLAAVTRERDDLAASLDELRAGAQMVNNAVVDAVRGKKGRLTVMARRTKEIRMAFDLPQHLAQGTTFQIMTPGGRNYTGADPAISMAVDVEEYEPMAALDLMPETMERERAARVHLAFKPTEKLDAGTYRIDVLSEGVYLNSVLLNLR